MEANHCNMKQFFAADIRFYQRDVQQQRSSNLLQMQKDSLSSRLLMVRKRRVTNHIFAHKQTVNLEFLLRRPPLKCNDGPQRVFPEPHSFEASIANPMSNPMMLLDM